MEDAKKRAAAISAVLNYIRTEEETAAEQDAAAYWKRPWRGESVPLWSLSGRQSQMQIRRLMNMKTFHGAKFR